VISIEAVAPTGGEGIDQVSDRFTDPVAFIQRKRQEDPEWRPDAVRVPTKQIVLRWTNAIVYKFRKATDYLQRGIIKHADAYVIAVNACNLGTAGLHVIEEYEIPLRSVFPFGDVQAVWDVPSGEIVEVRRQHRAAVIKANQSSVPTNIFLDPKYELTSAILAANVSPFIVPLGERHFELAVVHNPLAQAPLPVGSVGAEVEIVAKPEGNMYRLEWISG
jgi:hypothetical protein